REGDGCRERRRTVRKNDARESHENWKCDCSDLVVDRCGGLRPAGLLRQQRPGRLCGNRDCGGHRDRRTAQLHGRESEGRQLRCRRAAAESVTGRSETGNGPRTGGAGAVVVEGRAGQTPTGSLAASAVAASCWRSRSLVPSTSISGRMRSSQAGIHQDHLPMITSSAGISTMRTTKASKSTPAASAKPKDLTVTSGSRMNEANTEIMMTAAAVTTRAPWW